ncbi:MAG: DUF1638 domain-containing protein [Acidimicrobiia bacterium]|nr:DUF1638 domain-containing protein [Acidimicrobiia bacterium]
MGAPVVIACGALAGELRAVLAADGLSAVDVHYLPANLHNRPERIVVAIEQLLDDIGHDDVFLAYADCGTGGGIDVLCQRRPGLRRLPGAHCYEVFAGAELFARLHDDEPGTFYLTDFLARHFDALVWTGLGLDRHPELRGQLFAHYRQVVLLDQADDPDVLVAAQYAADRLALPLTRHRVGRDHLVAALPEPIRRVEVR